MIYDLTNKRTRVENLQRMLRYLSFANDEPRYRVNVSGIYDEATEGAVRLIQREHRVPVTGVVDLATWNAVLGEYLAAADEGGEILLRITVPTGTVAGERSENTAILQILLDSLGGTYGFDPVPLTGIYDEATEAAVRIFRRALGIPEEGGAERVVWRRLAEEYNLRLVQ